MTTTASPTGERPSYRQDVRCTGCEIEAVAGIGYVHAASCRGGETVTSNLRFFIGDREVERDAWHAETGIVERRERSPVEMGLSYYAELACAFCGAPVPDAFTSFDPTIHRHGCTNTDGWEHLDVAVQHFLIDGREVDQATFDAAHRKWLVQGARLRRAASC